MIFEKSSTRTRVSFEVGMFQMGATRSSFPRATSRSARRADSRHRQGALPLRRRNHGSPFAHKTVTDLAEPPACPSSRAHGPVPSLSGHGRTTSRPGKKFGGDLKGRKIAWIGDGNNMAHSLMFGAPKVGMHITGHASGYAPDPAVIAQATPTRASRNAAILTTSMDEAVRDADIVETDVWPRWAGGRGRKAPPRFRRMDGGRRPDGQGEETGHLPALPTRAPREEVAAEVIDGPQSVIFDERRTVCTCRKRSWRS